MPTKRCASEPLETDLCRPFLQEPPLQLDAEIAPGERNCCILASRTTSALNCQESCYLSPLGVFLADFCCQLPTGLSALASPNNELGACHNAREM